MSFDAQNAALALKLKELAVKAGYTVGTAESCTGGLIAGTITAVAGSSQYFYGGIVSYDNSVKMGLLSVPKEVLNTVGAVSRECAQAMAMGAARALGVDCAVSVTGIAGPDGGTPDKPVGTVWFGVYFDGKILAEKCVFSGGRDDVRAQTVGHALEMLCATLAK